MGHYAPMGYTTTEKRSRDVTYRAPKRPLEKVMTVINHATVDSTQVQSIIAAPVYPATMTGLRWNFTFNQDAGTSFAHYVWAIVLVPDGGTIDTLVFTDLSKFYTPEKNCLVWGYGSINTFATGQTKQVEGSTKTMRKIQNGDAIVFIMRGITTQTSHVRGAIQLFLKG